MAGIDFPGRVEDQLRNILVSFIIMWIAANVPPQTLMRFAVPIYTVGVALLVAVAMFGMKLRSYSHFGSSWDDIRKLATQGLGNDANGERAAFIDLLRHDESAAAKP